MQAPARQGSALGAGPSQSAGSGCRQQRIRENHGCAACMAMPSSNQPGQQQQLHAQPNPQDEEGRQVRLCRQLSSQLIEAERQQGEGRQRPRLPPFQR